jgi:hypothetical protein
MIFRVSQKIKKNPAPGGSGDGLGDPFLNISQIKI